MGRKESNQTVNKQNSMCGLSSCVSPYLLILTARENVKSISFDIWQHKYFIAFKPCKNCYSLHDNMANTNSIIVAATDSEYFAIIFAKTVVVVAAIFKSESSSNMATSDIQPSQ